MCCYARLHWALESTMIIINGADGSQGIIRSVQGREQESENNYVRE